MKIPSAFLRLLRENSTPNERGCWIWNKSTRGGGYAQLRRAVNGQKLSAVARIIIAYRLGRPLTRLDLAMHKCDTPPCVKPSCVRAGTHKANTQDCIVKGRFSPPPGGPRPPKLGVLARREVRAACAAGARQKDVAIRFGVAQSVVSRIVRGVYPHGGK